MGRILRGAFAALLIVGLGACAGNTGTSQRQTVRVNVLQLAAAQYARGDYNGSIITINAIMERMRGRGSRDLWAALHSLRAVNLLALERYAAAHEDADRAVSLAPNNAAFFIIRGRANHGLERYDDAIADYELALRLNDDTPEIYYHRSASLVLVDRTPEAIADLERYLSERPNSAIGWYRLGLTHELAGNRRSAIRAYAQAVSRGSGELQEQARVRMRTRGCAFPDFEARRCG